MPDICVILIGHGSREPDANAEFEAVVNAFRLAHPEFHVAHGYIELARPLLAEAIEAAAKVSRRVVFLPLFLFSGGHVKNDLPLAVAEARKRFPDVAFSAAPALGVHPLLAELAWARAASAIVEEPGVRAKTMLLVVGRGASDPDANGDFCKLVRLVGEGRGLLQVEPTFVGITKPLVETSLDLAARARPERLVVLPYFLFSGRLLTRLAEQVQRFSTQFPWINTVLAQHLGNDVRVLDLLEERMQNALAGRDLLPCDACQYRTALPGLANQVGGLRALLYSVRHTLTHSQASPSLHLHRPLKKHVLICANADCAERGSVAVLDAVRREVKRAGRARDIKVTRTSCMGRCGEGPTVAVYPDGVWYRGVQESDASEIVSEHLLEDRLVARLVDDILH